MEKEYSFIDGEIPSGYGCNYLTSLFSGVAYRQLHSVSGWHSYHILDTVGKQLKGSAHFFVQDGVARCPLRAPFGSVDLAQDVPAEVLLTFLTYIEDQLRLLHVSRILVKLAPEFYDPERLVVAANYFITRKYTLADAEVGAVIPVTERSFHEIIHARKQRKLQQSRAGALRFVMLDGDSVYSVYSFIAACRQPKNFELSISYEDLLRTVETMPKEYPLFAVFHNGEMVAASVAIRVYENILYHFISDHIRKIGGLSPALILMEGIYNYCRKQNISLLDLGTSTVDRVPNYKLVKFKSELGAKLSHKFTFEKDLSL